MITTEEIMKIALKLADFDKIPADSTIYVKGKNIKKILFGIDAGPPELLFAKNLGYDAVIAHHPQGGSAFINFHQVFQTHVKQMVAVGVPKNEAEQAASKKLESLEVLNHTRNYGHAVDFARLLKLPYMNIHMPLDEVGRRRMAERIRDDTSEESTVANIVEALNELPEYRNAQTKIKIRMGNPNNPAGKTTVSHGAGTNGGTDIARAYFRHGVQTLIYIHISMADLEKLRADGTGNLIITGHIASDSVGINPLIKELESQGITVTRIGIVPP